MASDTYFQVYDDSRMKYKYSLNPVSSAFDQVCVITIMKGYYLNKLVSISDQSMPNYKPV